MDKLTKVLEMLGIDELPNYSPELEGRLLDKIWELMGEYEFEYDENGEVVMPVYLHPRYEEVLGRLFDRFVQPDPNPGPEVHKSLQELLDKNPKMKKEMDESRERIEKQKKNELQVLVN